MCSIPPPIADPPKNYPHIENRFGCCGVQPTLKYDNRVSRLRVKQVKKLVVDGPLSVDEFVQKYGTFQWNSGMGFPPEGKCAEADDLRKAVREAIDYCEEYEEALSFLYQNYRKLSEE